MIPGYWYFIKTDTTSRVWARLSCQKTNGDRIEPHECQGYVERMGNGSWMCFVSICGFPEYIGTEPNAKLARARLDRDYWFYSERAARRHNRCQETTEASQ